MADDMTVTKEMIEAGRSAARFGEGSRKLVTSIYEAMKALDPERAEIEPQPVVAWEINFNNRRVLCGHNAIGDYRQLDPKATVRELIYRPSTETAAEKEVK